MAWPDILKCAKTRSPEKENSLSRWILPLCSRSMSYYHPTCTRTAIGGAAHTARWGSCPSYSAARNPPPLSSLRSETGAVPRLGGGCTQAACFFSISSAAGSTSTASCCFPLRVLVGFCKSSALTASRACVCGILQVRSTVNCSRHHHAR